MKRSAPAFAQGFDVGADATRTTGALPRSETTSARCLAEVYLAPEKHWMLYELAEKLVDFEDYFRRWRFNHVTTVERIIGLKRGTGGTSGVSYLRKCSRLNCFRNSGKFAPALKWEQQKNQWEKTNEENYLRPAFSACRSQHPASPMPSRSRSA